MRPRLRAISLLLYKNLQDGQENSERDRAQYLSGELRRCQSAQSAITWTSSPPQNMDRTTVTKFLFRNERKKMMIIVERVSIRTERNRFQITCTDKRKC